MPEPSPLTATLTEFIARQSPGSRLHEIGTTLLRTHGTNQDRRAAVLAHPDLAKRLTEPPLSYKRPEQWNGYIPPAMVNLGPPELCRSPQMDPHGGIRFRFNQLGHDTVGEIPNDSPCREALLDISREAWERSQPKTEPVTETLELAP